MDVLGLNPQAVIMQAVTLIILVLLLGKFAFRPVLNMLDERANEIDARYSAAEAQQRAMEQARLEYQQRLTGIEAEAREHIQAAVKEAQALREQIVTEARSQGDALVQRATEEITREKQKALVELRSEVANLAVDAAGKILGRSIDAQAHRDLLSGVIEDVGRA
jgi:F-type H+-transporting ATPase subunit b